MVVSTRGKKWITIRIVVPIFGLIFSARGSNAATDEVAIVRDRIVAAWGGIDSLEFRTVERIENQTDEHNWLTTHSFAWKADGSSAFAFTRDNAGGTTYLDIRDDGTKRVSTDYFPTPPRAVNRVVIDRTRNSPGHYGGLMFSGLWPFLPGGKTLASILVDGGKLENVGGWKAPRWKLTAQLGKDAVECLLDEAHDFLPRELTINNSLETEIVGVDEFERADGFWYPAKGTCRFTSKDKHALKILMTFETDHVSINRPIPLARFRPEVYPPGIELENRIDNTRTFIGGKLARVKLLDQHPVPRKKAPTNDPVIVASNPDAGVRWMATVVPLFLAGVLGLLGVYLRRRGG